LFSATVCLTAYTLINVPKAIRPGKTGAVQSNSVAFIDAPLRQSIIPNFFIAQQEVNKTALS